MIDLFDEDERKLFGEALFGQLQAIREGIANLPTRLEFNELRDDVEILKADMVTVKSVLAEHSRTLAQHSSILARHSRILAQHGVQLSKIERVAKRHTNDINFLKQALA